jgi:Spy/CpxP family protein refolding chaperone
MQKTSFVAVIAALTCSLLSAAAPNPPTVADRVAARVARLTKLLTLTTAQATNATSLFTVAETAEDTIRTNLTTAHTALTTAVEANNPAGITAAANQIGTLTANEVQTRSTADAAFYATLTASQQSTWKELQAAGLNGGPGGRGPGGHGGPGGPHHP